MTVVASFSIKGGVGKTSTAVNLAHIAASQGMRTLLWDLDPQGAASFLLNASPGEQFDHSLASGVKQLARYVVPSDIEGLDVIPTKFSNLRLEDLLAQGGGSNIRMKAILYPLLSSYDMVILDCPPGVSLVGNNALNAADLTVVPVIPTPLSVRTLRQLKRHLKHEALDTDVLPFFCMHDSRRSTHKNVVSYHRETDSKQMLETVVPYSAMVERMGVRRRALTQYAAASAPAQAYRELFAELQTRFTATHDDAQPQQEAPAQEASVQAARADADAIAATSISEPTETQTSSVDRKPEMSAAPSTRPAPYQAAPGMRVVSPYVFQQHARL